MEFGLVYLMERRLYGKSHGYQSSLTVIIRLGPLQGFSYNSGQGTSFITFKTLNFNYVLRNS